MPSPQLPRTVFAMDPVHLPLLFPPPLMERLRRTADIDPGLVVRDFADPAAAGALARAEVLITGWGCPHLDAGVLAAVPRLDAVLHAAGSVRSLVGEALWERGVTVSSAVTGNALPVAEYTLAMILLVGKDAFDHREHFRRTHAHPGPAETAATGNLGRRVGVIGASRVGRRLLELLRPFDLTVLLHDPYVSPAEAAALGAESLSLEELLGRSDIVSLHAPDIPETHHMLDRDRLALVRDGACSSTPPGVRWSTTRRSPASWSRAGSARSSTSPTRSHCPPARRCTTCPTCSSPRTSPARWATNWSGSAASWWRNWSAWWRACRRFTRYGTRIWRGWRDPPAGRRSGPTARCAHASRTTPGRPFRPAVHRPSSLE